MEYTKKTIEEIFKELNTNKKGLSEQEAKNRLLKDGYNELQKKKKEGIIIKFIRQFNDMMVIVLIIASIISGIIDFTSGESLLNTYIILAIVIANAFIGVMQELRAENSINALNKMTEHTAKVKREGKVKKVLAKELCKGDIVVLEDGDYVPADIRIIFSVNLKAEESSLTGESVPVEKNADIIKKDVPLAERKNMLYASSLITYGRAEGIVVETAMNTEVGKIAKMLNDAEEKETPLKKKLNGLGKTLALIAGIICLLIFLIGVFSGRNILSMLITSISLAVAAIPEGLPAIATIVQAMGVKKLANKKAVVKKMPAVETLGSATVICSDKTGTLTQNKMTVTKTYTVKEQLNEELYNSFVFCNNAKITEKEEIGDPTETALLRYVKEENEEKYNELLKVKRIYEIPFDSQKKYMIVVVEINGELIAYIKGGIDEVYTKCRKDSNTYNMLEKNNEEMAKGALRVLMTAYAKIDKSFLDEKNKDIFLEEMSYKAIGLVGMIDPPRKEVKGAIEKCKKAGIMVKMITGDHLLTASAIAKDLNIIENEEDILLSGNDIENMTDEALEEIVEKVKVFARVSPEHKVRIVKALQNKGHVVAMTGDGVNDAPALKNAEIGCAMGITGTDVSKEAADLIIMDDNFATIVGAVEEGRRIFENILKSIKYLLSSNIGELVAILLSIIFSSIIAKFASVDKALVIPLIPIQILWINLVTDSLPALSLAEDKANQDIMEKGPKKDKSIFTKPVAFTIAYQGILIGILTFAAFIYGIFTANGQDKIVAGQTMAFLMLGFGELMHVFNVRHQTRSMFNKDMFKNTLLNISIILNIGILLLTILVPVFRDIFNLTLLNGSQIVFLGICTILPNIVTEIVKFIARKREKYTIV